MPLNILTLNVESPKAYTHHGVPVVVSGIAQVIATFNQGVYLYWY